jgi:hypothetical protein
MKFPKWLRGPSSVSTGFSEYIQFTPIEAARLKGHLRKVMVGGRKIVLRRDFVFPWVAQEVNRVWAMDGTAETLTGEPIRVSVVLPDDDFNRARDMTVMKLLDVVIQQKRQAMADHRKIG